MAYATHFIGMNSKANIFIGKNKLTKIEDKSNVTYGMFAEPYYLQTFKDSNGNLYYEREQRSIWSGGMNILTALKCGDEWVKETLWVEDHNGPAVDYLNGTYNIFGVDI
jgi:hypothetical protein